ncbi:MAG: SurA N-terminal domain-containing protein [bacterium]|jgi:hypothetical protein
MKKSKSLVFAIVAVVAVAFVAYLLYPAGKNESATSPDSMLRGGTGAVSKQKGKPVAVVEGIQILSGELDARTERELNDLANAGMTVTEEMKVQTRREQFAKMVVGVVIDVQAKKLGVESTDEQVDAEVKQIIGKFGGEEELLAALGSMGMAHGIGSIEEFKKWKKSDLNKVALIEKVGADVTVDEAALKLQFAQLMKEYEASRDAGKPAFLPAGSEEEFIERELMQKRLVKFDKFIDEALLAAEVKILSPDLEGAIEEYAKSEPPKPNPHGGGPMSAHGGGGMPDPHGGGGMANPHGGMPPGHPPADGKSGKGSGA